MLICMAHDQQQILPFNTPDSLRVLWKSMDWRLAGFKSRTRFDQVGELVMAIKCCGRNDGCRAYVATLIAVANRNSDRPIIRNHSHFYEVLKTARELGFIASRDNWGEGKRAPSDREVLESRIAEVVARSRELRRSEKPDFRPTIVGPSSDFHPTNTLLYLNPQSLQSTLPLEASSSSAATSQLTMTRAKVEEVTKFAAWARERLTHPPGELKPAIFAALNNRVEYHQVVDRVEWFIRHQEEWPAEHRAGALHWGLMNAQPGAKAHTLWPYRGRAKR